MLQEVLEHIHNMFIKTPNPGNYTIADGFLSLPFVKHTTMMGSKTTIITKWRVCKTKRLPERYAHSLSLLR